MTLLWLTKFNWLNNLNDIIIMTTPEHKHQHKLILMENFPGYIFLCHYMFEIILDSLTVFSC